MLSGDNNIAIHKDVFIIEISENDMGLRKLNYVLYNVYGTIVKKGILDNITTEIDVSGLSPSIYLLSVVDNGRVFNPLKIIKE